VEQQSAMRVAEVLSGSPAKAAGLAPGDLVVGLDGVPVASADDLQRLMDGSRVGKPCAMRVLRGGEVKFLLVVPREMPGR
jgi:S1-C subfamily serine protease